MNSAKDQLKSWAYDVEAPEPMQDYDLMLVSLGVNDLILEFASDDSCPKQNYFLSCLYLIVGDAIRTDGKEHSLSEVSNLLQLGASSSNKLIQDWIERSKTLLSQPELFDYDLWCGGGHASSEL